MRTQKRGRGLSAEARFTAQDSGRNNPPNEHTTLTTPVFTDADRPRNGTLLPPAATAAQADDVHLSQSASRTISRTATTNPSRSLTARCSMWPSEGETAGPVFGLYAPGLQGGMEFGRRAVPVPLSQGAFRQLGTNIGGPPPKPLPTHAVKVENGQVMVQP